MSKAQPVSSHSMRDLAPHLLLLLWMCLITRRLPCAEDHTSASLQGDNRGGYSGAKKLGFCHDQRWCGYTRKEKKKKKLTSEHLHDWVFPNISCGVFCQFIFICLTSVQCSRSVMSNSLQPHGLQHARLPCPSSTPRAYSNSCPLSRWSHPTISSSVVPFSSRLQSFPAPGSFPMSQFFSSGGQIMEFQLQHQSFQWIFRTDFL